MNSPPSVLTSLSLTIMPRHFYLLVSGNQLHIRRVFHPCSLQSEICTYRTIKLLANMTVAASVRHINEKLKISVYIKIFRGYQQSNQAKTLALSQKKHPAAIERHKFLSDLHPPVRANFFSTTIYGQIYFPHLSSIPLNCYLDGKRNEQCSTGIGMATRTCTTTLLQTRYHLQRSHQRQNQN